MRVGGDWGEDAVQLNCIIRYGTYMVWYGVVYGSLILRHEGQLCLLEVGWRHAFRSEWPFIINLTYR